MKAPEPTPLTNTDLKARNTPDFKEHYANSVRVGFTPYDLSLMFGLITADDAGPYIAENLVVRVSPQQLKSLVTSLPLILAQWESNFGKIEIPEQMLMTQERLSDYLAKQLSAKPRS